MKADFYVECLYQSPPNPPKPPGPRLPPGFFCAGFEAEGFLVPGAGFGIPNGDTGFECVIAGL